MLTRLSVTGFKSLANLTIEFGRVNVLIGANGSGKTNILEAMGVLGAAADGRVDDSALLRRGVRPGVPTLYKSSFRGASLPRLVRFVARGAEGTDETEYAVSLDNPIKDPHPAWRYRHEALKVGGKTIAGRGPHSRERRDPERGLAALQRVELEPSAPTAQLLDLLTDYAIFSPATSTLRGLSPDPQQRRPLGLSGGRLADAVLHLLGLRRDKDTGDYIKEVCHDALSLIDWSQDFDVGPPTPKTLSPGVAAEQQVVRFTDRFMADSRNKLTGYDASEGALYVLFAAALMLPSAPRLLAIDNLDAMLNPRLARELMGRLCDWVLNSPWERQIILTTHNPLALDGLDLTNDDVRLFAVDRANTGKTVARRICVDERLLARAKEGWTLSRLWVMGELGGVPNV